MRRTLPFFFRHIAALLVTGALLLPLLGAIPAEAAEEHTVQIEDCFLYDDAGLLSDEEEAQLNGMIQETAASINMNLLIFVGGEHLPRSSTQMFCEETCVELYGYDADSVVYYMDLSGHDDPSYSPYDFIYTRNRARFYFTDDSYGGSNRIDSIFYSLDPYLPRCEEDIPGAVGAYLRQLEKYYKAGPDYDYYYYVPDKDQYVTLDENNQQVFSSHPPRHWGLAFLIGLGVSLVITLLTMFGIKRHYKFKDAASSLHYLQRSKIRVTRKSDQFMRRYETRVKIESSSGGGGGFSGTSSGGGGGGHSR